MRRLLAMLLVLGLSAELSQAQALYAPINPHSGLNRGLLAWWQVLPGQKGLRWRDLVSGTVSSITGTTSAYGFQGTTRQGGVGEVRLNGTTDQVTGWNIPVARNGQLTASLWVRYAWAGTNAQFIGQNFLSQCAWSIFSWDAAGAIFGAAYNCACSLYSAQVTTAGNLADGRWHHVVMVLINTVRLTMYTDAVQNGEDTTFDGGAPYCTTSTSQITMGAAGFGGNYLDGALDDVRIYGRALSLPEIRALYTEGRTGSMTTMLRLPTILPVMSGAFPMRHRILLP